jgi:acyl-CoA thioesterase I
MIRLKKILLHSACISALLAVFLSFTASPGKMETDKHIAYFPIGDSYTIGEGTTVENSWPELLTRNLNEAGVKVKLLANLSVTGYTTQNAIDHELPSFIKSKPDFASLLIGVNDWVQGVDEKTFHHNLVYLLDEMQKAMTDKSKLILVTIPDFSAAPSGNQYARGRNISEGLARFNSIIMKEAAVRNLKLVDVFDLSKAMAKDASLVAADGLHPSASEYALWQEKIFPVALELLNL